MLYTTRSPHIHGVCQTCRCRMDRRREVLLGRDVTCLFAIVMRHENNRITLYLLYSSAGIELSPCGIVSQYTSITAPKSGLVLKSKREDGVIINVGEIMRVNEYNKTGEIIYYCFIDYSIQPVMDLRIVLNCTRSDGVFLYSFPLIFYFIVFLFPYLELS